MHDILLSILVSDVGSIISNAILYDMTVTAAEQYLHTIPSY